MFTLFFAAKHIAAVFEKLGYKPEVGVEIFNGLCTALAEQRLAFSSTRQLSGRGSMAMLEGEEQDERDVADILAGRSNSADDDGPAALITHFPLANVLARTMTSTYNAATLGSGGQVPGGGGGHALDQFMMTKMDVTDFVAACDIDDVLIQAIQLKPRKNMREFVVRAASGSASFSDPSSSPSVSSTSSKRRTSASSFVYMEGWLEKQGSQVRTWKKRWFVLHRPAGPGQCYLLKYYTAQDKATEKVRRQTAVR